MFTRAFLTRSGKQIRSTATGRGLLHSLPEIASKTDMAARWEAELDAISQKKESYNGFMQPLLASLHELITQSQAVMPEGLKNVDRKPAPNKKARSGKTVKKAGSSRGSKRKARLIKPG